MSQICDNCGKLFEIESMENMGSGRYLCNGCSQRLTLNRSRWLEYISVTQNEQRLIRERIQLQIRTNAGPTEKIRSSNKS
jgi:DNA-directed RNA polymerase subunit RPC12/RpoP